jgi:AMIN domain
LHRRSTKAKQVSGSREMKDQPDVCPLFRCDPEESFNLWMQSCFPRASLSREDAIQQWLAMPMEARVQSVRNARAESAKSHGSVTPGPTAQKAIDAARSNETHIRNQKVHSEWNLRLMDSSQDVPFVDSFVSRIRNNSKLLRKFARYAVLAPLIVIILWASPTNRVTSLMKVSIAATQPSKAKPAAGAILPVPPTREAIEAGSDLAIGPITIDNLSVGCQETQPCIEISTRGKMALPKLSTLSDPDRVVMDFYDAVFSSGIHRIAVGRGAVRAIRIGEDLAQPPRVRVVIDLTEKCGYELHTQTNGVVLKVYPKATHRQAG